MRGVGLGNGYGRWGMGLVFGITVFTGVYIWDGKISGCHGELIYLE